MILREHLAHFERLRSLGAFRSPMLMLGNQECCVAASPRDFFGVGEYTTLDPDGGDLPVDLSSDCSEHHARFACVFNLGTIEHIWDVHEAYCNAARMVRVGGAFINHAPVGGWENHGVHVTSERFIRSFFSRNGFRIDASWLATQSGAPLGEVSRGGGCQTHWMLATKVDEVENFAAPQQVFRRGVAQWP